MIATVEPSARYRLAPGVAIRPERFGGLVYRYDNRRLYFLHSRQTVELVDQLDGCRPLREIIDDFATVRQLPETARDTLLKTVAQLEHLGLLTRAN